MKRKKLIILLSISITLIIFLIGFAHRFVFNVFGGRVHFPEAHVGENLTMEDGKKFLQWVSALAGILRLWQPHMTKGFVVQLETAELLKLAELMELGN